MSYSSNTDAGTAKVTVTGKGDYASSADREFTITPKSISAVTFGQIADATYTGSEIIPVVTVRDGSSMLSNNKDYTVSGNKNINVGTAELIITGQGNYKGTATASFKIVPAQISNMSISKPADMAYTGSVCMPEVVISNGDAVLTMDKDYVLTYSNNIKVGTAQILIEGKGNYTGSKTIYFNITGKSIEEGVLTVAASQTYTGSQLKPSVTVKLKGKTLTENTDFFVSYSNNTNVGTATVTVSGKGNYTGTTKTIFKIYRPDIVYSAYGQKEGQLSDVKNGGYAGTKGKGLRLELIKIKLGQSVGGVSYRTYVQKNGWTTWAKDGAANGMKDRRLEAFQLKLTGTIASSYDVYYRVYAQRFGWLGWAKNGESAGTAGYGYRLEGVQIKLLSKTGDKPLTNTKNAFERKSN